MKIPNQSSSLVAIFFYFNVSYQHRFGAVYKKAQSKLGLYCITLLTNIMHLFEQEFLHSLRRTFVQQYAIPDSYNPLRYRTKHRQLNVYQK